MKVPEILKGTANRDRSSFNPIVKMLVDMNDNGETFDDIANYIEKNL